VKIAAQTFRVSDQSDEFGGYRAVEANDEMIVLPGGDWPLKAEFIRQGPDLLISGRDGESFVVRDYFQGDVAADLVTESGSLLRSGLIDRLATGTPAPGQYAQAAVADSDVIGQVETVLGNATAQRADGTEVTLGAGDPIYAGDVLQTAGGASLGVVFADKTKLSLGEDGRLVMDEFVYDPGAKTGAMDVNIVQGVFTFVSGEIAKVGPDAMTVYTPVATVGIRGTKVAGRASAEGQENTFSLLPNDDGSVGVIAIANQSGAAPQILSTPGASMVFTSQFAPPPPPFVLSQAQIQQQYGGALQTLSAVQQSFQTRQQNQPDQGQGDQQGGDAGDQAGEGGDQTSGEGEPQGPSEEELAAREAAEAALEAGETPEGVLEAAVEAAAEQALAEGATPEEAAEAEAAAREAFGDALAAGETPEAALEAALDSVAENEFDQAGAGLGPEGPGTPGDVQLALGPGDGQDEVLGAAQGAAQDALAEGASTEEAFDAAVEAAKAAAIARGEDPAEVERIAAEVRENFADAQDAGLDPVAAMQTAFNAPGEETRGGFQVGPDATSPLSPDDGPGDTTIAQGPNFGPAPGEFGNLFGNDTFFGRDIGPEIIPVFRPIGPLVFEVPDIPLPPETFDEPEDDNIVPISEDTTNFVETIFATSTNSVLSGGAGDTEFIFNQNDFVGDYTVTDSGSTLDDRITFEALDGLSLKMSADTNDADNVKIEVFATGASATASSLSPLGHTITVNRAVDDLQASTVNLADLSQGIVINGALDVTNNETAYILSGTSTGNTLTVDDSSAVGALVFGKDGDDSIHLSSVTTDHILFGGDGTDTVNYAGIAGSVLMSFKDGGISVFHGESSDAFDSIEVVSGGDNQDFIKFEGTDASGGFQSILGGAGNDKFLVNGSASSNATLDGGTGNDDYVFTTVPASHFHIGSGGYGANEDSLVFGRANFSGENGSTGALDSNSFFKGAGAVAQDSDDFFIFDTTTLVLSYDADGNGAGAAQAIAVLGDSTLDFDDISFVEANNVAGSATHSLTSIADLVIGSDGADNVTLTGAAAADDIFMGGDGRDTLNLDNSGNVLTILNTELINGGSGADTLTLASALQNSGGLGATVTGGGGTDVVHLAAGVNQAGFTGIETINGSTGEDQLFLENSIVDSTVTIDLGSGGDDLIDIIGTNEFHLVGTETVTGSSANDVLTFSNVQSSIAVALGDGTDTINLADGANTIATNNVETIVGGTGADTVTVNGTSAVHFTGGASIDTLTFNNTVSGTITFIGGTGSDVLNLAAGNNTAELTDIFNINGTSSDDNLVLVTNPLTSGATVDLGSGSDTLTIASGNNTTNLLNIEAVSGTAGSENLTVNNDQSGTTFDLRAGTDTLNLNSTTNTVTLNNVEQINNTSGSDTLTISNNLTAGETISMGTGTDTLNLASGSNTINITGVTTLNGSAANDSLTLTDNVVGTTIDLGSGSDILNLSAGTNSLTVTNTETVVGNSSADTIVASGSTGVNVTGNGGADSITLSSGSDIIKYLAASDSTSSNTDTITGFDATGADQIDISALVQGSFSYLSGNPGFSNTGNTQAQFDDGSDTLQIDVDGNGVSDMDIVLTGVVDVNLSSADFITV